MELHCRYSLLLLLAALLGGGVLGREDGLRRLRREVFEVESVLEDSKPVGLRALKSYKSKYDKSGKKDKSDKSYKKDKSDKSYKKDKSDKSYKKDKYDKSYKKDKEAKYDKYATTRQVDIGGGVMMSMPLDVVMVDMSMSMRL